MAAVGMARNDLVGVRFTPEEQALLDRLVEHFESAHPGMRYNKQMVIRAAVFAYAKTLGLITEPINADPPVKTRPKIAAVINRDAEPVKRHPTSKR